MLLKIGLKIYELLLSRVRKVDIQYFIDKFPARSLSVTNSPAEKLVLRIYIPFRDKVDLTLSCLSSLYEQNFNGLHPQVYLIDNGSGLETRRALESYLQAQNPSAIEIHKLYRDIPFNFSILCNEALHQPAQPGPADILLFLNNDIVLNDPDSLRTMAQFLRQNVDVGAAGITLLYPDQSVQHAFAAPGVKIIAAHPFKGRPKAYLSEWKKAARRVPAVTGACMMMRAQAFQASGGFDENLPTAGQDIDLCLKFQAMGYSNWVLPMIEAVHLESASRRKTRIDRREVDYIHRKWGTNLTNNAEYPEALSRWSEQPAFRLFERSYPYQLILSGK